MSDYKVYKKAAGENSEQVGVAEGYHSLYRLDVPATGLLVLVKKGGKAPSILSKTYYVVVSGQLEDTAGTMEDLLFHDSRSNRTFPVKRMRKGVREASLSYEVIGYNEESDLSLVKVSLDSGRTHQIRAQFSSRKHPVAGDGKYGSRVKCNMALHMGELILENNGKKEAFSYKAEGYPWDLF